MGRRFKLNQEVYATIQILNAGIFKAELVDSQTIKAENYLLLVIKCWSTKEGIQFNKVCISSTAKEGKFNHQFPSAV